MRLTSLRQDWYWSATFADLFLMLWSVGNAVLPFILGAAAAYLLDPVADRLEGMGLSRTLAVVVITRYSSLGALAAAAAAPVVSWWLLARGEITVTITVMCAVLIYRHKSNIRKLLAGSEGRIGGPKSPPAEKV